VLQLFPLLKAYTQAGDDADAGRRESLDSLPGILIDGQPATDAQGQPLQEQLYAKGRRMV
jgi:hypothetical protein